MPVSSNLFGPAATAPAVQQPNLACGSSSLPNVVVNKAKHIIPVRDAIKSTFYANNSSNFQRQTSPSRTSNGQNLGEISFISASSSPKQSPHPTANLAINSNTFPSNKTHLYTQNNLIYQTPSQLSHQSNQSISLNRLMSHPYFRTYYLLTNNYRKNKKSPSNSIHTTSNADQVEHSTNSTLKSYLSASTNHINEINNQPIKSNRTLSNTLPSGKRKTKRTSSKKLTEEQLRKKIAQYEYYIATQLDKVDSANKKMATASSKVLSQEQWQKMIIERIFLASNCVLLFIAFLMLTLACILDPNPIHKLNSKGGFYAFNAVLLIFLSLIGLYGIRPIRRNLLFSYAIFITIFLVFRVIAGLVMLIFLENNQFELIFLLSIGLVEVLLMILALAVIFNTKPSKANHTVDATLPDPVQVHCEKNNLQTNHQVKQQQPIQVKDTSAFSKSSALRRSINENHSSRTVTINNKNQPSILTTYSPSNEELIYLSPENLVFNERSVDAPPIKQIEKLNSNYASNLSQYSTLSNEFKEKKKLQNGSNLNSKTTFVPKTFEFDKLFKASNQAVSDQINQQANTNYILPQVQYLQSSKKKICKPIAEVSKESSNFAIDNKDNFYLEKNHNLNEKKLSSTNSKQSSSSFISTNLNPIRTSTPSSSAPVLDNEYLNNNSPTIPNKTSIFDYNYSPLNFNQILHQLSTKPNLNHATTNQVTPIQPKLRTTDKSVFKNSNGKPSEQLVSRTVTQSNINTIRKNIMVHKMNFLNNNTDYSDQYKQNIVNQVLKESSLLPVTQTKSVANLKWPRN